MENIDLELAVWNGKILLHNMKVKPDEISRRLGVDVHRASVQRLEVHIPWTALLAAPIKVTIDGLYVQVGPESFTEKDLDDAVREQTLRQKRENLARVDEYINASLDDGTPEHIIQENIRKLSQDGESIKESDSDGTKTEPKKSNGYLARWLAQIMDNIEVNLHNVHLRYEDSISIASKVISAGNAYHYL